VPEIYKHPDTGEEVEIPEGSEISYTDDGEIFSWTNPPETPKGELHPSQVEGYEPHFDPLGPQRRTLAFITDFDNLGRGPRNTAERVGEEMDEDPFSAFSLHTHNVQEYLDELEGAGLVKQKKDGTYSVTKAGQVELAN
jgi:hypothetical protein